MGEYAKKSAVVARVESVHTLGYVFDFALVSKTLGKAPSSGT